MPVVWIIDSELWPRTMLRAELIERGLDAVGYLNAAEAMPHLAARSPNVIVVDLHDVARGEVAELFTIGVPVIGVAALPAPQWRAEFKWAELLRRPISLGDIADAVMSRV